MNEENKNVGWIVRLFKDQKEIDKLLEDFPELSPAHYLQFADDYIREVILKDPNIRLLVPLVDTTLVNAEIIGVTDRYDDKSFVRISKKSVDTKIKEALENNKIIDLFYSDNKELFRVWMIGYRPVARLRRKIREKLGEMLELIEKY